MGIQHNLRKNRSRRSNLQNSPISKPANHKRIRIPTPTRSKLGPEDDFFTAFIGIGGEEGYMEFEGFEEETFAVVEGDEEGAFGCYG